MKVAVLLSGCGVYDGAEIQESVLTLLSLERNGIEVTCFAPNIEMHHVINHQNGEQMQEVRNVLVESARITRGQISDIIDLNITDFDALVMPGGFGVAKNFTKWAFEGEKGDIDQQVQKVICSAFQSDILILAMCMSPTVIAKALQGSEYKPEVTVGSTLQSSSYDIKSINETISNTGTVPVECKVEDIYIDEAHGVITTPCYMMDASISQVALSIDTAVQKLVELIALKKQL